jgi:hypothetical protein
MKKVVAGLIVAIATSSAFAWGEREQGALAGIVGTLMYQRAMQPQQVYQPQVIYQQQPQQVYIQPEYRTLPQYTQQYLPPNGVSCVPAYTAQGQYLGCIR